MSNRDIFRILAIRYSESVSVDLRIDCIQITCYDKYGSCESVVLVKVKNYGMAVTPLYVKNIDIAFSCIIMNFLPIFMGH